MRGRWRGAASRGASRRDEAARGLPARPAGYRDARKRRRWRRARAAGQEARYVMEKLGIGDLVVLTSGSMRMAVEGVEGEKVACVWCHEGAIGRDAFDARLLKKWEYREEERPARSEGGSRSAASARAGASPTAPRSATSGRGASRAGTASRGRRSTSARTGDTAEARAAVRIRAPASPTVYGNSCGRKWLESGLLLFNGRLTVDARRARAGLFRRRWNGDRESPPLKGLSRSRACGCGPSP